MKLVVVGDSGLGKSTLIKALLSTPNERLQVKNGNHDKFRQDPDSLCTSITWRDDVDRVVWTCRVQDTPGYGHLEDVTIGMKDILSWIEKQSKDRLQMERSLTRQADLEELEDTRVDLCLYCIGPHRLRPIDLKFMYEIGLHVPVVPVVTKADTMTAKEAEVYRTQVADKIANPMVPGVDGKINVFNFGQDAMSRAGVEDNATRPPFFVIASDEVNEGRMKADAPTYWPERCYEWGVAEAYNTEHSDLLSLRALVFKEALQHIIISKRQRYEVWRRSQLRKSWLSGKVYQLLGLVMVPAAMFRFGQAVASQRRPK